MKFRFTLKRQLLLFSVVILLIPWTGYQYVRGMEAFLKASMEDAINTRAHSIAMVVSQRADLLSSPTTIATLDNDEHLYLRSLDKPIQLDGYSDDWQNNQDLFREYNEQDIFVKSPDYHPGTIHFSQATGQYKNYLYALLQVSDDRLVYHDPNRLDIAQNDYVNIGIENPDRHTLRYAISTAAPGRLSAHLMSNDSSNSIPIGTENRIQGVWQETASGYSLELRIPLSMIGSKLSFSVHDIDHPEAETQATVIGSADIERPSSLSTIVIPSAKLENLLTSLGMASTRIWIIDKNKKVLALSGNLDAGSGTHDVANKNLLSQLLAGIYRLILQQPASAFEDILSGVSKLNGREIESALQGKATSSWRDTKDKHATILTASYPIMKDDTLIGAVMLEQNSQRILLLQNRAMEKLINISIPFFVGGTLLILIFAGRITSRITQLRNQTESAISTEGKITQPFQASGNQDEIGDLSRSFADLLERLQQYNRYLETMAAKLSHELRTPLSVVRSSLDNLEQINPEMGSDTYITRARGGVEQLNSILNRLSEATRLEQALQQTEKLRLDLGELVRSCIEGYRLVYPEMRFEYRRPVTPVYILGAPELLVQMLDKLISNAVDFSATNTPVDISLDIKTDSHASLRIRNQGPHLPCAMQASLFDSLVSVREKNSQGTHLGLGLYIAKLIVDYHSGHIEASNTRDPQGVSFEIDFKLH